MAQVVPLAPSSSPPPQDLAPFWAASEAALKSLGISPYFLTHGDLDLVGPILLGPLGWRRLHWIIAYIPSWAMFKCKVEELWGLDERELLLRFYRMRKD